MAVEGQISLTYTCPNCGKKVTRKNVYMSHGENVYGTRVLYRYCTCPKCKNECRVDV